MHTTHTAHIHMHIYTYTYTCTPTPTHTHAHTLTPAYLSHTHTKKQKKHRHLYQLVCQSDQGLCVKQKQQQQHVLHCCVVRHAQPSLHDKYKNCQGMQIQVYHLHIIACTHQQHKTSTTIHPPTIACTQQQHKTLIAVHPPPSSSPPTHTHTYSNDDNVGARRFAGQLSKELARGAADVYAAHASVLLPLAWLGLHDEEADVAAGFQGAWEDGSSSTYDVLYWCVLYWWIFGCVMMQVDWCVGVC